MVHNVHGEPASGLRWRPFGPATNRAFHLSQIVVTAGLMFLNNEPLEWFFLAEVEPAGSGVQARSRQLYRGSLVFGFSRFRCQDNSRGFGRLRSFRKPQGFLLGLR
jgi:hypothetical protein